MHMRKLTSLVLLFLMTVSTPARPASPMPRKSPELTISEPSGKTTLLSSFKGKVVVLEFLFVKSTHCARVAQTLNKLNGELGPRGLQAVGIVFDAPDPSKTGGQLLPAMVENLKLTYPVGYANSRDVDSYLGRTGKEILAIPQVVVIDRAGFIRAATGPRTDPGLEDENSLRTLLDGLLKESPPAQGPAKTGGSKR
ncbi:MAG: TlpA family protein disulfide reductase [Acidobacteriia bacterium]|nr:TlpA family protein disulfide reductase [Terriglobia bacterium]